MISAKLLDQRSVIVTGAGQGLGQAIAEVFACHGARVAVADLNAAAAADVVSRIEDKGGTAMCVEADVRDPASAEHVVHACQDAYGTVDVLVNNASVLKPSTLRKMTVEVWDEVLDVHLKGSWLMMREASKAMRGQRNGTIVNISSIVAKTGGIAQGHYAAAKAAIVGLTKTAAKEWAPFGVRVNTVQPGLFGTPGARTMSEEAWQARVQDTPLGRAGEPHELANAVLFLASDLSSFVTGAVLEVTGGRDM